MTGVSPGETRLQPIRLLQESRGLGEVILRVGKVGPSNASRLLFTSPERHHGQVPGLAWRIDCCLSLLGVTSPGVSSGEPSPPCIAVIQIPGSRHADLHRTASKAVESPADTGDTGLSAIIVECT